MNVGSKGTPEKHRYAKSEKCTAENTNALERKIFDATSCFGPNAKKRIAEHTESAMVNHP